MSDSYLNWEELVDFGDEAVAESLTASEHFQIPEEPRPLHELLDMDDVPEEIKSLVEHGLGLERKVKSLVSGGDDDNPDAERDRICYAVPVHTKETRIDERRAKRREEELAIRQRLYLQRKLEAERREQQRQQLRLDQQEKQRLQRVIQRQRSAQELMRKDELKKRNLVEQVMMQNRQRLNDDLVSVQQRKQLIDNLWLEQRIETREQQSRALLCQRSLEEKRLAMQLDERDQLRKQAVIEQLKNKRREEEQWEQRREKRRR